MSENRYIIRQEGRGWVVVDRETNGVSDPMELTKAYQAAVKLNLTPVFLTEYPGEFVIREDLNNG